VGYKNRVVRNGHQTKLTGQSGGKGFLKEVKGCREKNAALSSGEVERGLLGDEDIEGGHTTTLL